MNGAGKSGGLAEQFISAGKSGELAEQFIIRAGVTERGSSQKSRHVPVK